MDAPARREGRCTAENRDAPCDTDDLVEAPAVDRHTETPREPPDAQRGITDAAPQQVTQPPRLLDNVPLRHRSLLAARPRGPAVGTDASGHEVRGYWFDVSGKGTAIIAGGAKNRALYHRLQEAADATD